MQKNYSKEFKMEAVKKSLSRNSDTSLTSIAKSLDVKISTLYGWIKENMANKAGKAPLSREGANEKSPKDWTVKEKFESIMESSNFSQEEIGQYCRKRGIFPHHLDSWKVEFLNLQNKQKTDNNSEIKNLKSQIKSLNIELRRKEKALAEAATLLVLKKKVHDLWNHDEED